MPTSATCRARISRAAPCWWRRRGSLIEVKPAGSRASLFQRFQKCDHVRDLARVEPELRHCRMTRDDAFGKSLFQVYDRILGMQDSEGRRDGERAGANLVDRVTFGAVRAHEMHASLL